MAIIKHMVAQKVIDGFKGTIDFYVYMGKPCARKWPKSPGKIRSPAVMAQWPIFSKASSLWLEVSPSVRQAYEEMAVTTNMTPRDIFTKGYISGVLRFYIPVNELEG